MLKKNFIIIFFVKKECPKPVIVIYNFIFLKKINVKKENKTGLGLKQCTISGFVFLTNKNK